MSDRFRGDRFPLRKGEPGTSHLGVTGSGSGNQWEPVGTGNQSPEHSLRAMPRLLGATLRLAKTRLRLALYLLRASPAIVAAGIRHAQQEPPFSRASGRSIVVTLAHRQYLVRRLSRERAEAWKQLPLGEWGRDPARARRILGGPDLVNEASSLLSPALMLEAVVAYSPEIAADRRRIEAEMNYPEIAAALISMMELHRPNPLARLAGRLRLEARLRGRH